MLLRWSANRAKNRGRFIPLRYRFILMTGATLVLLLGALALILGMVQSRIIRSQIEKRGLAIARNLAATSLPRLLTYDYVTLEQAVNQIARDPALTHVIVHDKEGRVAGYSGRSDLQHTFLDDASTRQALATTNPLIYEVTREGSSLTVLEVAFPVFEPNENQRWGTVRTLLPLTPMYQQIRQMRRIVMAVGVVALALGIVLSIWAARRITQPLGDLVEATMHAAQGRLEPDIEIRTGDEVEILALNFATMIRKILDHRRELEFQLAKIKKLQYYQQKLLSSMHDGLLSVDMTGKVVTINPAAQRLLGDPAGRTLRGQLLSECLGNDSALSRHVSRLLQNPRGSTQQELHLNASGGSRNLLVGSSILTDPEDLALEFILNLQDITDLKRLEAQVRRKERLAAVGTLAAGMSHEIRNPLSSIKIFVQLLPRKMSQPQFMEKFTRTVPREINRINQLVESLLDLARDTHYRFNPTDLCAVLKHTLDLLDAELKIRNVCWNFDSNDPLPQVSADADQLTKVFQNLILNAAQAMSGGGGLRIETYFGETHCGDTSLRLTDREVAVVFKDQGPGIPEHILKNIFNPFFTTKDQGTGLGLAIAHKVVTDHGGRIEVASQEDHGTRFTVILPV